MSEDNPYAPPDYPAPKDPAFPPPTGPAFAPSAGDSWAPDQRGVEPSDTATRPVAGIATESVRATRPTNAMARRSFILGACSLILTPLPGIAAVILGRRARADIARTGDGGAGLARAGIWMGGAFSLVWLLGAAFLVAVHMGSIAA